jgi:hypothetical protein
MVQKTKAATAFAEAFSRVGVTAQDFATKNKATPEAQAESMNMPRSSESKGARKTTEVKAGIAQKVAAVKDLLSVNQAPSPRRSPEKEPRPLLTREDIKRIAANNAKTQALDKAQSIQQSHLRQLHAAYNPPQSRPATKQAAVKNIITIANDAAPNLGAFPVEQELPRLIPQHDGIRANLLDAEDDEAEIYIGLDFGTSSTKVILQDGYRKVPYAVPFTQPGSGNPFLFPSRLFLHDGTYSLDRPAAGSTKPIHIIRDLKIALMRRPETVEYMLHATAYLALIVRHARGWLLSMHGDTYKSTHIEWGLNLGLPAEKSEDQRLNKRFKAIALAAINLAAHTGDITKRVTGKHLVNATRAFAGVDILELGLSVHPDMVGIYPEIAAQVVGFVESESWDGRSRPYITLIDIGAGTVDVSFFSVEGKNNRKFRFFQNKVAENGVMNLHRARIDWLRQMLKKKDIVSPALIAYLDEIYQPTDRLGGIPNNVEQYIKGLSITGNDHIDDEFKRLRYRQQVFGNVIRPVREKRVPNGDHWHDLPIFICGGGSRMPLYGDLVSELNNTMGISWFKGRRYSLSKPKKLIAPGLSEQEYDRLSVAYGLSFPEIGRIIKSGEIPNFVAPRPAPPDTLIYPLNQD